MLHQRPGMHPAARWIMLKPRDFVLVHGAWHGGWCWERVAALLRQQGHRVFTPTLTGLAERAHLMSHDITLNTHIHDVVNVFRHEQVENAILVGHSFGGWVVSGATEELRTSVAALVFLDAHVPRDGQIPRDTSHHRDQIDLALREGRPSTPPRADAAEWFGVNERDRARVQAKLTDQPVGVYLHPLHLTGARDAVRHKVYVRATLFDSRTFDGYRDNAKKSGWRTHDLSSGHDLMIDAPDAVSTILIAVAATE
jgi:pimeloyl-ACP methyl ester carboxylesterase